MSWQKLLLKNVTYINRGATRVRDILIENGRFVRIDNNISATGCDILDCANMLVIPGVIDDQVHFREPGNTNKATIASESVAAVLGGTTSFMDMPNNTPPTTTLESLANKNAIAAKVSPANYSFYLGATNDNLEQIKAINPQEVCGVKIFMGSSTGSLLVDNDEALREIFWHSPVLIATHCEDNAIITKNMQKYVTMYGDNIEPYMHALIRSREACLASSRKAIALAEETHANLHVLHLSTKEELELFQQYAKIPVEKRQITAEVCVHHLYFNSSYYAKLGSHIKCNPAIKDESDRLALLQAVTDGTITNIATDHAPHTREEKAQPFIKAPSGLPLVQFSLLATLELVHRNELDLETAVTGLCHNPALRFKIKDRGFIEEGYYADFVVIDPHSTYTVKPHEIASKCGWSPFIGTTFNNRIVHTFVNGKQVVKNGKLVQMAPAGEMLTFDR